MREKEDAKEGKSVVVPPGFRFHPTDEELVDFYLRKKVVCNKFELDHVIPEVDLNKLEPWDLHETCKIDATSQSEWYFFSHKDKKYPTGTRTNRATRAGFWKATGRDKAVMAGQRMIGMRKTLVFYKGRAPHGLKTHWIMHEYRLQPPVSLLVASTTVMPHSCKPATPTMAHEDGWVVCRVFKKKMYEDRGNMQRTSSYDQSVSNISDEDPSPICKSTSSTSKAEATSPCSNFSSLKYAAATKIKEEQLVTTPALPLDGINLPFFARKLKAGGAGDPHYGAAYDCNNNQQPPPPPFAFYEMPYLESSESICAPQYTGCLSNAPVPYSSTISISPSMISENQAKGIEKNHKAQRYTSQFADIYETVNSSELSAIPFQYLSRGISIAAEDNMQTQLKAANIRSTVHHINDASEGWSLHEQNGAKQLQGDQELISSLVSDHQFGGQFSNLHYSKVAQQIDTYPSSYEIELWNFPI
ncbi:hypothetical protein KP509_39G038000 [Ceratopteris richardii]|uniref:NAC domain-containing protein n=1 Tax=Ceratopteris richardii TaxID=49495 RepID=A0A8T2Q0H1_CERRI|nr:hypothetical protein KP509_39G038000 [Ceratopteris richardii]